MTAHDIILKLDECIRHKADMTEIRLQTAVMCGVPKCDHVGNRIVKLDRNIRGCCLKLWRLRNAGTDVLALAAELRPLVLPTLRYRLAHHDENREARRQASVGLSAMAVQTGSCPTEGTGFRPAVDAQIS